MEEEVRRAKTSAWTLKYVTGICETEGARRPACALVCYQSPPQIAICPFYQYLEEMTLSGRGELVSQVPEEGCL